MADPTQPLDPLAFPFRGNRLIEASAGTGKTWTLALLYTRLVLGHGDQDTAFPRPLTPPEILVVTFTDAATKELRERIRARLVAAAAWFDAPPTAGASPDLVALRAGFAPADWPACARRLRQAAEWMDEAVIATIHGWCQRMLQTHAFATRGPFQRELVPDQSDLLALVVRDYWRIHCYPLGADDARCVLSVVKDPAALATLVADGLTRPDAGLSFMGEPLVCADLGPALAACRAAQAQAAEVAALEQTARGLWRGQRGELDALLTALRPDLNGTKHESATPEKFAGLLLKIAAWADGAAAPTPLKHFAQGAFAFKGKAQGQAEPLHPAFQAIADWQAAASGAADQTGVPTLAVSLRAHATAWVGQELARRLRRRAEMGYDDLLGDLDAALNPSDPDAATLAAQLAATIRRQFPVALIDEFQDTDPIQYRIFDRIYNGTESDEGPGARDEEQATRSDPAVLVMIGDPKQAIYSFRGADIHSYLEARTATAGRHHTLGTNFRSTAAMVAACNRLFTHAEAQPRGAFRFATETDNPIPFRPVQASGLAERLQIVGSPAPAMTFWTLESDGPVGPDDYRESMAEAAASVIVRWLTDARAGGTGFVTDQGIRSLLPADIAILVRTGTEAAVMRRALAARRVNSVYLSDRDSVFQTQEARDVLVWLRAGALPTDEGLVRAALATNTLALPLTAIADWQQDEPGWEAELERFREHRRVWQRQGVLAMLRGLMHGADLPARLLARPDGERVLTNLLHLAEWLQTEALALDGEQALIRHLTLHLDASGEAFTVRLESDALQVRVITIHKSKGLEYPLVLLPFICGWRPVDGHTRQVNWRSGGQRWLEVAGNKAFPQAWETADDERLSEDMRLLYVAVTRARHAVWLGIAALKSGTAKAPQLEKSAIGHVLNGGRAFAGPAAVWQALNALCGGESAMTITALPAPADAPLAPDQPPALTSARPAPAIVHTPWWIASYSALRRAADSAPTPGATGAETAAQETALEEAAAPAATPDDPPAPVADHPAWHLHGLPRGQRYGTFLHGVLEWAAVQQYTDAGGVQRGFAAALAAPALCRDMLARRCALRGLTEWIDPLAHWLGDLLTRRWVLTGLPDADGRMPTLALVDLTPAQMQVELEFWLAAEALDTAALDRLVQAQCLPGAARPGIGAMQLNGMLKGFIDLVFEHGGRYYVLDWKSNWLGPDDAAYTPAAMREAILHSRYDLQYVLYLLALHRQLRARLPGYDYDQHIGGAVYVFLRGGYAPGQGLFIDRPPRALIERLDSLFAGAPAAS